MDFNQTGALFTTNEWLTPPSIIKALGSFDLDPCAPPMTRRPWNTAPSMYDESMNGFEMPWFGRVWLNPPYGDETFKWIKKLADHKNGIALIFARTDTRGFHSEIFEKANSIFFFKSRIKFIGIVSKCEVDLSRANRKELTDDLRKQSIAIAKRIKGKTLNTINSDYYWFKGSSANAPSCLISYSDADSQAINDADFIGKHVSLRI